MPGFTNAESVATLDARFPTAGATDHVAWSVNGTSEWAGLARTAVGATGWALAGVAGQTLGVAGVVGTNLDYLPRRPSELSKRGQVFVILGSLLAFAGTWPSTLPRTAV